VHRSLPRGRAAAALATGLTAAVAFSALTALPATAATAPVEVEALAGATSGTVTDAVFQWGVNNEVNNRAFAPGTFNFLSAGKIPKADASDTVVEADWKAAEGNTAIQKKQADGSYAASTWAGLRTDSSGVAIPNATSGKYSDNRVSIAAGTGSVDAEADDAEITWDGDFTVVLYSGLTQFFVSDPKLSVSGGFGEITATLSGYEADMADPTLYNPIPDTEVVLADLSNVDVTETGFSVSPDYLGVTITAPANGAAQVTTGANAGAFPQSFVDFQGRTGQSSYWYSSGGASDAAKVAAPISTTFSIPAPTAPAVTVSKTTGLDRAGEVVTVTGTGFLPSPPATSGTRPPLAGKFTGAYVVFGKFADTWKPSAGAPSSARPGIDTKWGVSAADMNTIGGPNAGAIEIKADGTFTAQLTVKNGQFDKVGNFGVYTYPGGGARYEPFETFTPVSFTDELSVDRIQGADRFEVAVNISKTAYPAGSKTAYIVTGSTYSDALSAAPAAVKEQAPLLLTRNDALPANVEAELKRLAPEKIVVVGGTASVSAAVETQLKKIASKTVDRVAGADRYEASRNVAAYAFGSTAVDSAYLATGTNFPDALSASAMAGAKQQPVILANGPESALDAATLATLNALKVKSVAIAGGPVSVSPGIEEQLKATDTSVAGTKYAVTRLAGADRFEASIAISASGGANEVYLATGFNFPDALAGAALAGAEKAPLYVVPTDCVPAGVLSAIDRMDANQVTLLGGPNSLAPSVAALKPCS
jgi:putative cell wall-binding protein